MPDEAGRSQRSFENRGGKWRRWALTVIASAGAGAVVIAPPMAALIDDSTPPTLATAPEPTTGPVTKELTHDERLVEVRVSQPGVRRCTSHDQGRSRQVPASRGRRSSQGQQRSASMDCASSTCTRQSRSGGDSSRATPEQTSVPCRESLSGWELI